MSESPTFEDESKGLDYKDWKGVEKMESMCMRCGGTGETRFMLHKIPFFRELIIASFVCKDCGERNNEVTFGGEIQLQGSRYSLTVCSPSDLNRQIIKSDSASVSFPAIEFEIPPLTQKGEITTIEGIIGTAAKNLSISQPIRVIEQPVVAEKVAEIIATLESMANGSKLPFILILDDPAGNSFIENPMAPKSDPNMHVSHYTRNGEQDRLLGLESDKGVYKPEDSETEKYALGQKHFGAAEKGGDQEVDLVENIRLGRNEVITIPSSCPNCGHMGESHTAVTDIPHFKEVATTSSFFTLNVNLFVRLLSWLLIVLFVVSEPTKLRVGELYQLSGLKFA
jgi:zinc finger protein